jgi:hypothetical protein
VTWLLSTMLKPMAVTLATVLAALNDVKDPLWPVSQPSGPAPLKPGHRPSKVLRPFWFDVVGAAEAVARTYATVPVPRPTSSMTSTRERVEKLLLVACLVSICDIFLDVQSQWDEDGDSPRNPLKFSRCIVD